MEGRGEGGGVEEVEATRHFHTIHNFIPTFFLTAIEYKANNCILIVEDGMLLKPSKETVARAFCCLFRSRNAATLLYSVSSRNNI
jgi:hypothetical protein